ncbi:MAG TPA: hypothetical protein VF660_09775 [Actinomycetota bacterium]
MTKDNAENSIFCPKCGSDETLRVEMTLGGAPASFTTCCVCEWRGWERAGHIIRLDDVLEIVSLQ